MTTNMTMQQIMSHAAGSHSVSKQTLQQGIDQIAASMGITYQVIDVQTGYAVRRNIKTLRSAHNIADRLDNAYGTVRYIVRREA